MRILLAVSNFLLANRIEDLLIQNDFKTDIAADRDDAFQLAKLYAYDLIIIGHDPIHLKANSFLRQLQSENINSPVITLVKGGDYQTMAQHLTEGADDSISTPCHPLELVARAKAIIRRSKGQASQIIEIGDVVLNMDHKTVTAAGEHVNFSSREYDMFALIAMTKGVVSAEAILSHLYNGRDEPTPKIVDVFLCKIRRKLRHSQTTVITTVRQRGYILELVEHDQEALAA